MPTEPLAPFTTVHASTAMVATADGLATQAGVHLMRLGGNAVDAAIAANAVLAVTAPHLCGMGGDLFALVHEPGVAEPAVLNASGRAGSGADLARLRAEGHREMPLRLDVRAVPVPGCVDGWDALHARFGRAPLADVLAPAIGYAANGFPASPLLAASVARLPATVGEPLAALRTQATRPGAVVVRPGAAGALESIVADGRNGFYGGVFGSGLVALGAGEYTSDDLERRHADWVSPLVVDVWGHRIWTVPPNSQGYLTLAAAWIADGLPLPDDPDDPAWPHYLIEAALAAGHDRPDVLHETADGVALLASGRLGSRRDAIGERATGLGAPAAGGDTTYLCVVDGDGMGVSLIQSNASGFGSLLCEPTTGINLHNRGLGFAVDPDHPAAYGPGRRPPHTLSPAVVTTATGELAGVVGTQGGDGQPQILLQVLARWLHGRQSPGRAIASPRWVLTGTGQGFDTWTAPGGPTVVVEGHAPAAWITALRQRGHRVMEGAAFDHVFGHANLIAVADVATADGVRAGAADPRSRIGSAAGF